MVKFGSTENRSRIVFLLSLVTSIVLIILFLSGSLLTNMSRGEIAYTQVDMAAGFDFRFCNYHDNLAVALAQSCRLA